MDLMAPASAPARFSADEFRQMVEADAFGDLKVELVGGLLHRMPLNGDLHSRLQMSVVAALLRGLPHERVRAGIGVQLGNDTVVGGDAAIVDEVPGSGWLNPAEVLLIVEVAVSTTDRDLSLKRRLYAEAGIPTYWVVDAAREVIHVFDRPVDGDYAGLSLTRFGEPLAVPGTDGSIVVG